METATTYELYFWDCPECGTPQECGDIEPSGELECEDCGAIAAVGR